MGVVDFYAGRSILLTGGAGYLGRHFVEKLLRVCPEIQRIYLLLRGTKSLNSSQRYQQLLQFKVFDSIRDTKTLAKVVLIDGDLTLPGLGLNDFDRKRVIEDTSVVIHSGATVNLAHNLKKTFPINTLGTKSLLGLSLEMKKLESFVHVSTAYSNTGLDSRDEIKEEVYPPPTDLDEILKSYEKPGYLDKVQETFVPHQYGNGYILSKSYTEALVERYSDTIPLSIFRPSIMTSAWKEPSPGWLDCNSFVSSIVIGAGDGLIRAFNSPGKIIDLIPTDVVVDSLVVAAWHSVQMRKDGCKLPVYNCTSSKLNPITWKKFNNYLVKTWLRWPTNTAHLYPNVYCTTNKLRVWLSYLNLRLIYILFKMTGNSSITWTKLKHVKSLLYYTKWVTIMDFIFTADNQKSLTSSLSTKERNIFNTDISKMDWEKYTVDYVKGVRKYVLNENDVSLKESKKKLKRLLWLSRSGQAATLLSAISASVYCFQPQIGLLLEML